MVKEDRAAGHLWRILIEIVKGTDTFVSIPLYGAV